MTFTNAPQGYIIRLVLGEDLHATLVAFCAAHGVRAGIFHAIGAVRNLTLAYYDLERKQYLDERFDGDLEIVSLTGNIAMFEGKPFLHIHGVFSGRDFHAIGGHVKSAIVAASCEVYLMPFDADVRREHDALTGLKLCVFEARAPTTSSTLAE